MNGRRRFARLAFAALTAATLLLAACSSSSDEIQRDGPTEASVTIVPFTTVVGDAPLVVVLGDSNTYDSSVEITDALTDVGLAPDVRGISGSGLKDNAIDWLPAAERVAAADPAAVVVALGTNDAVTAIDATTFAGRADELLDALGTVPVVWVTHTEGGDVHAPEYERQINDAIRDLPRTHPNVTVLDLAPLIAAEPDVLGADRLHYEGAGRRFFADQIAAAATARVSSPAR